MTCSQAQGEDAYGKKSWITCIIHEESGRVGRHGDHSPPVRRGRSVDAGRPGWFAAFVADRATAKPSVHTLKAYRQDFDAIAARLAGADPAYSVAALPAAALTRDGLRAAFADYAATHRPASIRRCWSSWNVLCTFLYTGEAIGSNPMPAVKQPRPGKTLPKSLGADAVTALVAALDPSPDPDTTSGRGLARTRPGAGADRAADRDARRRAAPRRHRRPARRRGRRRGGARARQGQHRPPHPGRGGPGRGARRTIWTAGRSGSRRAADAPPRHAGAAAWPARAPLFVGADGTRITRGTLQYRVLRAFRRAGIEPDRATGALVHGLRHTYATGLADAEVNVYTLMKLLGHQSMATSQRYVDAAGLDTRPAAARNPVYRMLTPGDERPNRTE